MRLKFILVLSLVVIIVLANVLPVGAQATNFFANVGCDALSVSGTAGVSGSLVINATAGATALVTANTTTVAAGQPFNVVVPYSAAQLVGTAITVTTTLGTFTDTRTVTCTGNLSGGGDGRLNDLSAPIAVYCSGTGVSIINIVNGQGVSGINANGGQIANGLAQAAALRQNTQIVGAGSTSLWALSSGELQAVFRGFTQYDFIFSPSRCGIVFTATINVIAVTLTPTPRPGVIVYGPIYVPPVVGTPVAAPSTSCVAPTTARAAHIVRSGENLFRIGLRYGVDFRVIAAYNGIVDPARIYVGQCIIIP